MIDEDALIGGLERREIVIVEYDPSWPQRFERERARLERALGARALGVEHVGSTAVPGLAAKPIVDILVTVVDPTDDEIAAAMEAVGYELRVREPAHRMFRTAARDIHVHLWAPDSPEVNRLLAFREHLRDFSPDRLAYEALKRELAGRSRRDMNEYADAKGPFIERVLEAAEGRAEAG